MLNRLSLLPQQESLQETAAQSGPSLNRIFVSYLVSIAVLVLLCLGSLALGSKSLSLSDLLALSGGDGSTADRLIVFDLRFSRTVNALLVGAALGASGAIMQSVIRNPIADPGILGISAGASLGVASGIMLLGAAGLWIGLLSSLLGALLAAGFLFLCAMLPSFRSSAVRITLCGIAFSAVLAGITQGIVLTNDKVLDQFRFWQVGSLTARPLEAAVWVAPLVVAGLLLSWLIGGKLNILDLGDDSAQSLGISVTRVRTGALLVVALLCGPATSLAGPVAFIGFAVPHIVRLFIGHDTKQVIRFSALTAPFLLLICDIIGRLIGQGAEVPVGIVTAVLGSILLMLLVAFSARRKLA